MHCVVFMHRWRPREERERKDVCILRHVNDDDLLKRKKLEGGRGFLALLALLSKLIFKQSGYPKYESINEPFDFAQINICIHFVITILDVALSTLPGFENSNQNSPEKHSLSRVQV